MYTGNQLREMYLNFFAARGHSRQPSASLIPRDDPTLLLTVAGMVPFKPYFLRKVEPPFPRATTSQKCVRTPDLEVVGKTARHHTFFEMLGNFSFGDYFKKDAIHWAWEYITEVLQIDTERLWVSIYPEDEEARAFWLSETSVKPERIVLDETNFWAAGPTGPCGPCSEIYVDQGESRSCGKPDCAPGCDCDRYLEIWNLVFMQYSRDEAGTLTPLPKQNIDTGMGLERIASVLQNVETNFDTDLFQPLIQKTAALAGVKYHADAKTDVALKVVADHARAVCFMLADGIGPSSDGRGYVLRRILRRAVRYAKLLGIEKPFLADLYAVIKADYAHFFTELVENENFILNHLRLEEKNFQTTLAQGLNILRDMVQKLRDAGEATLSGQDMFRLFETYGFPPELTEEILQEEGLNAALEDFQEAAAKHKELARQNSKQMLATEDHPALIVAQKLGETKFSGYTELSAEARVVALFNDAGAIEEAGAGEEVLCVLESTPFYSESGGQISDTGTLTGAKISGRVTGLRRLPAGVVLHSVTIETGVLKRDMMLTAAVDADRRLAIARHHTATHLLHRALKTVLGDHVQQAGSLVDSERLRFDFTHFSALTTSEISLAERLVNEQIMGAHAVNSAEMSLADAKATGAEALFGEKYGDSVRVVTVEGFSRELCGGTHVGNTGELGSFMITGESGIGSGLRRLEAVTGWGALAYLRTLEAEIAEAAELLKAGKGELVKRAGALTTQLREAEREAQKAKAKLAQYETAELLAKAQDVEGLLVVAARVQASDMEALRQAADLLKDKITEGVIVLGAVAGGKVNLVTAVKPEGLRGLHAGKIIKEVASITGGSGGGRPDMAQAGGKEPAKLGEALDKVRDIVRKLRVES